MRRFLLLILVILAGCSNYNYDILRKEQPPLRVTDSWQQIDDGVVAYRVRTMDGHLVVFVTNTTADPLQILGDRSYLLTPTGESIRLQSETIAPLAHIKLVLPPLVRITHPGPTIGIGLGYSTGGAWDTPQYLSADDSENYWEWHGETNVTLHIAFESHAGTFEQTLVFRRIKA